MLKTPLDFCNCYTFRFGDPTGQHLGELKFDSAEIVKCGYVYRYPRGEDKNKCFFAPTAADATKHGRGKAAMLWKMQPTGTREGKDMRIRDGDSVFIQCYQTSTGDDCYLTFKSPVRSAAAHLVTSSIKQKYRIRLVRLLADEDVQRELYGSEVNYKEFDKAMKEFGELFVQKVKPSNSEISSVMKKHATALRTMRYNPNIPGLVVPIAGKLVSAGLLFAYPAHVQALYAPGDNYLL